MLWAAEGKIEIAEFFSESLLIIRKHSKTLPKLTAGGKKIKMTAIIIMRLPVWN